MNKFLTAPALAAALTLAAPALHASNISFVSSFKNLSNTQTADGNSVVAAGGFYSSDIFTNSLNPYTSATMTYPGAGSPVGLPQISPAVYEYQSSQFATKADMDTAFPTGTYSFTGVNGALNETASYQYTADDYAQSIPFLTGTDFSSLQGMDASQAFTFHFSPFVTGGAAGSSFVFFNIFDTTTNSFVYNSGFLSSSTTSLILAANTLTVGHQYQYELDFSNRDAARSPGADFDASLGFDVRTAGTFQATATPEPSSVAFVSFGLAACATIASRKRKTGTR